MPRSTRPVPAARSHPHPTTLPPAHAPVHGDHVRHPTVHAPRPHAPLRWLGPQRDHAPHPPPHRRGWLLFVIAGFCLSVLWSLSCVPSIAGIHLQRELATTEAPRTLVAPSPGDVDGDGLPDALEDRLLARYSPTALVAANDASMPASVPWVRARTALAMDGPRVMGLVVPKQAFTPEVRRGSRNPKDWVMYGHAFPRAGGGVVLQYWLYFPFNAGPMVFFDHESDWEHVSVELDKDLQPEQFVLARHNKNAPGIRYPWNKVPKEGDHPIYLVAWGLHAAYLSAKEAPFWEHVVDCPRRADGSPLLAGCPVNPGVPAASRDAVPIVNVGERAAPRLDAEQDSFFMRYAGLWGDPAVLKLYSASPPGPPFQAGFCADAAAGSVRVSRRASCWLSRCPDVGRPTSARPPSRCGRSSWDATECPETRPGGMSDPLLLVDVSVGTADARHLLVVAARECAMPRNAMPRKWLFVLPNLFTVSSIFCGVYAITQAASGAATTDAHDASLYFYRAAIAIMFGGFFDGCDGRVARLTRTESEFGVQLDSLADVITFGVAPAILLYNWALSPWGPLGVCVAGIFATCGALRLARFNVMAGKAEGPASYFVGLPIPLAAGMVVAIVVAVTQSPQHVAVAPLPIAILTLFLSWLMVSTVKYHSFKKMRLHVPELLLIGGVLISGALVANRMGLNFLLLTYATAYILIGLIEEVVFHKQRRALALASAHRHSPAVLLEDEDEADVTDDEDA